MSSYFQRTVHKLFNCIVGALGTLTLSWMEDERRVHSRLHDHLINTLKLQVVCAVQVHPPAHALLAPVGLWLHRRSATCLNHSSFLFWLLRVCSGFSAIPLIIILTARTSMCSLLSCRLGPVSIMLPSEAGSILASPGFTSLVRTHVNSGRRILQATSS